MTCAGQVRRTAYDFKGNLLSSTRRLRTNYTDEADWSALTADTDADDIAADADPSLEDETFTTSATYDALNRVVTGTSPDASVHVPVYNEANQLASLAVKVRGAGSATDFVTSIDYNARGQRLTLVQATTSALTTAYTYDALTFRIATLVTTRAGGGTLQSLTYTFDPAGNVVAVADDAQEDLYYANTVVSASNAYTYDPTYRLTYAEGREHAGNVLPNNTDIVASVPVPHVNDMDAVRRYHEDYTYDAVANFTELAHTMEGSMAGTWSRTYDYASGTNRLTSTSDGSTTLTYGVDDHGNTTSMPHLAAVDYDYRDKMAHADLGGGGDAYYVYDARGTRIRKVIDTGMSLVKERIYLGGYELYREIASGDLSFERQTLHVMDDVRRIAMVETQTADDDGPITSPTSRTRYQLSNHLETATVECDDTGAVFGFEEYSPYGVTVYRSGENGYEVSGKRYRYCGAERDDETGFYCMGARYYCPWLGRWTTADPLGLQAGINVYLYCRAGPVSLSDPSGLDPDEGYEATFAADSEREPDKPPPTEFDPSYGTGQGDYDQEHPSFLETTIVDFSDSSQPSTFGAISSVAHTNLAIGITLDWVSNAFSSGSNVADLVDAKSNSKQATIAANRLVLNGIIFATLGLGIVEDIGDISAPVTPSIEGAPGAVRATNAQLGTPPPGAKNVVVGDPRVVGQTCSGACNPASLEMIAADQGVDHVVNQNSLLSQVREDTEDPRVGIFPRNMGNDEAISGANALEADSGISDGKSWMLDFRQKASNYAEVDRILAKGGRWQATLFLPEAGGEHAVTVAGKTQVGDLVILDPGGYSYEMDISDFGRIWTGWYIGRW